MTRLERLRNRSYTAAIGSDINRLPIMNGILFNNDILYFNPHFSKKNLIDIYTGLETCKIDNLLFVFTEDEFGFSDGEVDRLNKLWDMFHLSKRREKIVALFVTAVKDPGWVKPPMKCCVGDRIGYIGKTDSGTSVYMLLSFVGKYTFSITVVANGFISPAITNPIRNTFESELNSYLSSKHEGYSFDDVNIIDKLRGKYYLNFNSCIKSTKFIERLKNDEEFSSGMNELGSKNVIINIAITDRRFI